jgi:hypothetical protein
MPHFKAPDHPLPFFLSEADILEGLMARLPVGSVEISDEEADDMRKSPPPTQAEIEAAFTAAIQKRLDDFARTRNYDGMLSACTYATSSVAKFQAEGQACVDLRDATWAAAYAIMEQVKTGQRAMPDDLADIEADLPALEWPQ